MQVKILVPSVGESVKTASIESWEKSSGDYVEKGDILVLLETDKASMEVPAPESGLLTILKKEGEVLVGDTLGYLEETSEKPKVKPSTPSQVSKEVAVQKEETKPRQSQASGAGTGPAVRHLLGEQGRAREDIQGTGRGGRILKADAKASSSVTKSPTDSEYREPMSKLRKRTAEKLVYSQQSTATLSTFNEVDMTNIISLRKKYQDSFIKKHQVKLGFMSFFVKAVVKSLKKYPRVHARIEGTDIVYSKDCHIGIAISSDKGLVVPVLKKANDLSFADIEKQILEYGARAKNRKLSLDDLQGGSFTISNGGIFGSLLSTPILNPPQSGILGMHTIQSRPVVRDNQIVIRPMMYVTLSYDHRIIDGRESVSFLVKVKEYLEDPAKMLIDF